MRSALRFVMHPQDEAQFARHVLSEAGTVFVDGSNWPTPRPPIVDDIGATGGVLMIWNPSETPALTAERFQSEQKGWWSCDSAYLTLQFLRSGFQFGEPFLFEGRIAVCTTSRDSEYSHEPSAAAIERRFRSLRSHIKKAYTNGAIVWQDATSPGSPTDPLAPDSSLWVGPQAMRWLAEDPKERWVQQFRFANTRGYVVERVG